ncbi:hypothetical protein SLS53_009290 [Cytospora paraplurivora]|uniref:RBR-type E3 ubiquitin transferase n=1 Tax=Cytospora paraplurivora TaxID=2898453 RepID=A0AAN9U5H7_9PEZI
MAKHLLVLPPRWVHFYHPYERSTNGGISQDPEPPDTYFYAHPFERDLSACPTTVSNGKQSVGVSIAESDKPREVVLPNLGIDGAPPEDDQVDLTKYGLPEALTKVDQVLPEILDITINSSVDHIISQVTAESELRLNVQDEKRTFQEDVKQDVKRVGWAMDKGKAVERIPDVSTASDGLYTSSEPKCISCFDDFAPKDVVKLRCHNYCKPCFQRLVINALETEAQWPPKCCLNPIDHKTCLKNISGALSVQYIQKRLEYTTPIHARYYCPIPDCGLFVPADNDNTPFRRAKCKTGHLTCMDCREAAHNDAAQCVKNQDMDLVQRLANEEGWRRCHRCHTMIEHKSSCRHIRCRCGAQFCMVCGAPWWTCGCTERQLKDMKQKAQHSQERRRLQEERERREVQELQHALSIVAETETEAEEKLERNRAAREARRKAQAIRSYTELSVLLGKVNAFQKASLEGQHERDRVALLAQIQSVEEGLTFKNQAKMDELRMASKRKIEEKEKRLWEEYKANDPSRETLEDISDERTKSRTVGDASNQEDGEAKDHWAQYRDEQLKQYRWAIADEQAIEEEHMQAKASRILDSFNVQKRELEIKMRSELRWYELVVAERTRILEGLEVSELENEIMGEDDDRWEAFEVKEDGEAGPS